MFGTLHDNLCDTYEETRYKPVGAEWPPNQPKSIVSVALIHYKGKRTRQELFAIAQRHKDGSIAIDQMMSSSGQPPAAKKQRLDHSRVTKDIADIFTADPMDQAEDNTDLNKPPKRILIEGAPGIGKTVLVKEIAYRWANKELLQNIELVFLIYLRDPRLREIKSTTQLFQLFTSTKVATDVADYLQECNGSGVAFVIDGFDEYPSSLQHSSLIVEIIRGEVLHKAMVVVTSRPTATVSLHDHVDRRIDILGFAKEEREQYIIQSLSDCPEKKDELFKYLKRQPTINGFCYVPLHLAVLLYLFQQGRKLPETLTEMNESFIIHTIYRYLKRHKLTSLGVINKLSNLPEPILNVIHKISQVAFKGLQENQLVFTLDEITEMCPDNNDTPGAINGFGLLQTVQHYPQEFKGAGETASFNFIHYTMQEFLAAFHVSTLSDEEKSSLMEETFWSERFNFMWMMYVGIMGTKSKLFIDFISKGNVFKKKSGIRVSSEIQKDKRKRLHVFQCYTEANSKAEVPDIIASMFKDGKVKITGITLLPNHISSLVSFLSHCSVNLNVLKIKKCNYGDIGMNIVEQYITDSTETTSTLEHVDLMGNNSSPWNVYCAVIKQCSVSNLTLCGDYGMEGFAVNMDNCLSVNTALQSLTLCEIGNTGLNTIKTLLTNNKLLHLNELNLSWKNISSKATDNSNVLLHTKFPVSNEMTDSRAVTVNILWDGTNNSTPDSLNLSGQCEGDGVSLIAFGLCNNRTICTLDISNNNISNLGAQEIARALHMNQTLQTLNISSNDIQVDGAKAMAKALHENQALQALNISSNDIQVDGAKAMAKALHENQALQALNISSNDIQVDGAKAMAKALHENQALQTLNISSNDIQVDGAKAMAKALHENQALQTLNISSNDIQVDGAKAMAKALHENKALQTLNISSNDIQADGATAMAIALHENKALQTLNISSNDIQVDGAKAMAIALHENQTLQTLNISSNDIQVDGAKAMAEALHDSKALQYFDISNNNILDNGVIAISECIKKNSKLQELVISGNNISSKGAKQIAEAVKINTTLRNLDISNNKTSNDGVKFISDCLKHNCTLKELNLSENEITNEGVIELSEAIRMNLTLLKLNISKNWITIDGILKFLETINNGKCIIQSLKITDNNVTKSGLIKIEQSIKKLSFPLEVFASWNEIKDENTAILKSTIKCLSYNGHNDSIECSDIKEDEWPLHNISNIEYRTAILCDCLKEDNTLQELNLTWNNITNEGAKKIAEAIQVTKTLQILSLNRKEISDNGAAAISDSLKINVSLQELRLGYNNITTEGAKKIAEAIQVTKTLQILTLNRNEISDDGAAAISDSLKINVSLQELNLAWNNITNEGAEKIAEAIQVTKTLRKLNLNDNQISDDGAAAISDSLKVNKSLQELNIQGRSSRYVVITNKGAKYVSEAIQVNTALQKLDLSFNNISDDGAAAISDSLKINVSLQELNLAVNDITTEGAKKIAEAIQVTKTLQKLNLHGNKISDDGAIAISDSLKINVSLQELDLKYNNITKAGRIVKAIQAYGKVILI